MHLTVLEWISLVFSAWCIYRFIRELGVQINIVHAIATITCMIYLVMPVVAYTIYNKYNDLARLFQTVMPIKSNVYFSYALPATVALVAGLFWPLRRKGERTDFGLLQQAENYLAGKHFLGHTFVIVGLVCGLLLRIVPDSFRGIILFTNQLIFIGVFYLLFSPVRYKGLVLVLALIILFFQVVNTGMYGELIFWSLLLLIYLLMKITRVRLIYKLCLIVFGLTAILFIQSIKQEYRARTWDDNTQTRDVGFFLQLIQDRITKPSTLVEPKRLYSMTTRGNQGFLLARTIDYVPSREPFTRGETILTSIEASLVPRIFWKDKPALGGMAMTCRFLGDCGKRNYSYNIGQIGEAYVNFGKGGGVVFMFVYGFFINWMIRIAKRLSGLYPTIILWIPLLFYSAFSMETDVLTFLNSFVKGVIFCGGIFLFFRLFLRWKI